MTSSATRTIQKTKSLTILQRIKNKDRTAVQDCIDAYGNLVWAMARKYTASTDEAEAATQEIFRIFGDTRNAEISCNLTRV